MIFAQELGLVFAVLLHALLLRLPSNEPTSSAAAALVRIYRLCELCGFSAQTALETCCQVNDAGQDSDNSVAGGSRHRTLQGRGIAKLGERRGVEERVDA